LLSSQSETANDLSVLNEILEKKPVKKASQKKKRTKV